MSSTTLITSVPVVPNARIGAAAVGMVAVGGGARVLSVSHAASMAVAAIEIAAARAERRSSEIEKMEWIECMEGFLIYRSAGSVGGAEVRGGFGSATRNQRGTVT